MAEHKSGGQHTTPSTGKGGGKTRQGTTRQGTTRRGGTGGKTRAEYGPLVPNPMRKRPGVERARDVLGYTYPIDRTNGDDRFATALLHEIADVLERRGYPELRPGRDMFRLMQALAWFLYRRGA